MRNALKQMPLFLLCMAVLVSLMLLTVFSPRRDRSDMENRTLAAPVAVTAEGILSGDVMRQTEDYLTDHFIGRDQFILLQNGLDAAMLRTEKSGILLGSRLMVDTQYMNTETALENAKAIGALAAASRADATAVLVPLSTAITPERLPLFYQPLNQQSLLEEMDAATGLACLDTMSVLLPLGEAAYYRSDHHWTADGVKAVYGALCGMWGIEPKTDMQRKWYDGFYGGYYAKTPRPFFLADTFAFDEPAGVTAVIRGEIMPSLLDSWYLKQRDKYSAILYGNPARVTLEGPGEGVLFVVKDSFANALVPLLAQHFARVEMFDPRYTLDPIPEAFAASGAEKMLFVYGLTTLLNDRSLILQTGWEAE